MEFNVWEEFLSAPLLFGRGVGIGSVCTACVTCPKRWDDGSMGGWQDGSGAVGYKVEESRGRWVKGRLMCMVVVVVLVVVVTTNISYIISSPAEGGAGWVG